MAKEKGQGRPWWRRWGWWPAVVLLLLVTLGLVVLWVQAPALYGGAKPDAQATATATTRAGILAVWAAAIAALGAAAALAETRRANLALHEREREAQVTDRYTRAIDQLGEAGEDKVDVRLGGIYALQRIAEDSARDHLTIVDVLCAFVRHRAHGFTDVSRKALETSRPPTDVQAAVAVISRLHRLGDEVGGPRRGNDEDETIDLSEAQLERANLFEAYLQRADLRGAHLGRALLTGARLQRAFLRGAHLERAILIGADLTGADLIGAHLEGADLSAGAWLTGADLRGAHLEGADLTGTHLEGALLSASTYLDEYSKWQRVEGAYLDGARLKRTWLRGTKLQGSDLSRVIGLTQGQLDEAVGDEGTRLPAGLTRPAAWTSSPQDADASPAGEATG